MSSTGGQWKDGTLFWKQQLLSIPKHLLFNWFFFSYFFSLAAWHLKWSKFLVNHSFWLSDKYSHTVLHLFVFLRLQACSLKTYLFWIRESCCLSPRASATREEHSSVCRVQLIAACQTGPNPAQESGSKTNQQSPCAGLRSQSNPGVDRKQKEAWCMERGCL